MWEFLINLWCGPRWQLRPNLYPRKFFFYLILQEFCDFSGTRDLHYVIFLRIQFLDKYWFQAIFWFSSVKLDAKMDQNCKLWVHSIWAKIQNFEGFFKHCVSLTGRLPLFKISAKLNNICGSKGSNTPPPQLSEKRGHFMDAESIWKT